MTRIIMEQVLSSYGLECLSEARLTMLAATRPRRVPRQVWTGGKLCYAVQASQASAQVEHLIRQAASDDSAPRSACPAKR